MSDPTEGGKEPQAESGSKGFKPYFQSILWGFAAGFIFGLFLLFFIVGFSHAQLDILIVPTLIGGVISGLSQRIGSIEMLAWGASIGVFSFIASAILFNWAILQHAIVGAVTGFLLAIFSKVTLYFAK